MSNYVMIFQIFFRTFKLIQHSLLMSSRRRAASAASAAVPAPVVTTPEQMTKTPNKRAKVSSRKTPVPVQDTPAAAPVIVSDDRNICQMHRLSFEHVCFTCRMPCCQSCLPAHESHTLGEHAELKQRFAVDAQSLQSTIQTRKDQLVNLQTVISTVNSNVTSSAAAAVLQINTFFDALLQRKERLIQEIHEQTQALQLEPQLKLTQSISSLIQTAQSDLEIFDSSADSISQLLLSDANSIPQFCDLIAHKYQHYTELEAQLSQQKSNLLPVSLQFSQPTFNPLSCGQIQVSRLCVPNTLIELAFQKPHSRRWRHLPKQLARRVIIAHEVSNAEAEISSADNVETLQSSTLLEFHSDINSNSNLTHAITGPLSRIRGRINLRDSHGAVMKVEQESLLTVTISLLDNGSESPSCVEVPIQRLPDGRYLFELTFDHSLASTELQHRGFGQYCIDVSVCQQRVPSIGFNIKPPAPAGSCLSILFTKAFSATRSVFGGFKLDRPASCCVDSKSSRLFVVDSNNHRILAFNLSPQSAEPSTDVSALNGAFDAAAANDLSPEELVLAWQFGNGHSGAGNFHLHYPVAAVVSADGTELFVSDAKNSRVCVLRASDGGLLRVFGDVGLGPAQFSMPFGLCLMQVGNSSIVWVADTHAHRVQALHAHNGEFITQIGITDEEGSSNLLFNRPYDCACVGTRLFITDFINSRVQIFDYDHDTQTALWVHTIGSVTLPSNVTSEQHTPFPFNQPSSLCVDVVNSLLYIGEIKSHRISIFQLKHPYSFIGCFGGFGAGLVATAAESVTDLDCESSAWAKLKYRPVLSAPGGMGLDASTSTLFVVDEEKSKVVAFRALTIQ